MPLSSIDTLLLKHTRTRRAKLDCDDQQLLAQAGVDTSSILSQQGNDPSKMLDLLRQAGEVTDLGADTVRGYKARAHRQAALAREIQQLEASVGARLFDRDSKGVRLTAAGLAFQGHAAGLLERVEAACALAREVQAGEVGRLRVGFVGSTLYNGLSAWLQAFQASWPRVEVVVVEITVIV